MTQRTGKKSHAVCSISSRAVPAFNNSPLYTVALYSDLTSGEVRVPDHFSLIQRTARFSSARHHKAGRHSHLFILARHTLARYHSQYRYTTYAFCEQVGATQTPPKHLSQTLFHGFDPCTRLVDLLQRGGVVTQHCGILQHQSHSASQLHIRIIHSKHTLSQFSQLAPIAEFTQHSLHAGTAVRCICTTRQSSARLIRQGLNVVCRVSSILISRPSSSSTSIKAKMQSELGSPRLGSCGEPLMSGRVDSTRRITRKRPPSMLSFVPDPASFLAPTIPSTNIIVASPKDYGREVQAQPQPPTNKWLQSGANLSLDDLSPSFLDDFNAPPRGSTISAPAASYAQAFQNHQDLGIPRAKTGARAGGWLGVDTSSVPTPRSRSHSAPGYYDEARTPRAVSIPAAYTASAAPVLGENFSAEPCALYDGSLLPRRLAPSDTVTRSNSLSGAFDMAYTTHVQPTSASNTVQSDATTNAPLSGISHWKPDATLMQLACEVIEAHSQPHRRAQFETASHKFARAWLESSYVASAAAPTAPIRRSAIARSYQLACAQYGIVAPLSVSVVGKILKSTFPGLQHRRLGSRACSVWHYLGLKALTPHEEHMLGVVYDAMDAERRASAPTNKYALSEAGIHAQDSDCDEESSLDGTFDRCASFSSDSSHSRQNSISVLEVEQMLDNLKIKGRGVRAISDWPRAANTVSIGLDDLARTTWAQLEGTYQQQLEAFESLDFAMFKQLAVQQYRGASRDTIWAIWGNETLCGLVSSAETLLYEHLLRLLDAHISDPPIESVCAGLQDLATTLAVEVYASLHGVDGGPHPSSHARTSSSTTPRFPDAFIEQKCETVRRWSKCLAGICSIWSGVIELRSRSHLASEAWKGFAAPLDFTAHDSAQLDHSSSARFADFDGSAMDPDDYSLSRPPTRGADNSLNVEATSEIWQFNAPNSSIESMASSDINETCSNSSSSGASSPSYSLSSSTSSLGLRSRHMQENGFGNIITKWSDDDAEGERDEDFDQLISPASSTSSNMDWDAATPNKAASSTEHLDGAANNSGLTHLADVGPMLAV